ncbi:hypothetical protein MesoLj113a_73500 [Mesorhizobium sp. 113-1-2]|nr:hypothetical protein MesoLj113a_73500 [Mesorhizobium sp. 113-1-2]
MVSVTAVTDAQADDALWRKLTKEKHSVWARPSLIAHKVRLIELRAGKAAKKGRARPSFTAATPPP